MDKVATQAKAVVGFVVGFVVYAVSRVGADVSVLPAISPVDTKGWLLLAASLIGGYAAVYGTPSPGYIRPNKNQAVIVADSTKGQMLPSLDTVPPSCTPEVVVPSRGRHERGS